MKPGGREIKGLGATLGSLDKDSEISLQLFLPHILIKRFGPNAYLRPYLLFLWFGIYDSLFHVLWATIQLFKKCFDRITG